MAEFKHLFTDIFLEGLLGKLTKRTDSFIRGMLSYGCQRMILHYQFNPEAELEEFGLSTEVLNQSVKAKYFYQQLSRKMLFDPEFQDRLIGYCSLLLYIISEIFKTGSSVEHIRKGLNPTLAKFFIYFFPLPSENHSAVRLLLDDFLTDDLITEVLKI